MTAVRCGRSEWRVSRLRRRRLQTRTIRMTNLRREMPYFPCLPANGNNVLPRSLPIRCRLRLRCRCSSSSTVPVPRLWCSCRSPAQDRRLPLCWKSRKPRHRLSSRRSATIILRPDCRVRNSRTVMPTPPLRSQAPP